MQCGFVCIPFCGLQPSGMCVAVSFWLRLYFYAYATLNNFLSKFNHIGHAVLYIKVQRIYGAPYPLCPHHQGYGMYNNKGGFMTVAGQGHCTAMYRLCFLPPDICCRNLALQIPLEWELKSFDLQCPRQSLHRTGHIADTIEEVNRGHAPWPGASQLKPLCSRIYNCDWSHLVSNGFL